MSTFRYDALRVEADITHGDPKVEDCFVDVSAKMNLDGQSMQTTKHKCANCDFQDFSLCSSCHTQCKTDPSTAVEAPMSGCDRNIKGNLWECGATQRTCSY